MFGDGSQCGRRLTNPTAPQHARLWSGEEMANTQLNQNKVSGLPEALGLENGHGSAILGLNKPPGVSRIVGRHVDVGHAT